MYTLIENTLKDLNPYALPLDDVARANMPKLLETGNKYRRGFITYWEFASIICNVMGYALSCIKGFALKQGENIIEVYPTYDEAVEQMNEIKACDKALELDFEYTIERR